ncbi:hypothetical protein GC173_11385 [bacterium]|nr:hypothetical protein [bacterium]
MSNRRKNAAPGRRRPEAFPGAIWLELPGRPAGWYLPLPEDGKHRPVAQAFAAEEYLRQARHPIRATRLAKLMGMSRFYIFKAVQSGRFGEGEVLRSKNCYLIQPGAALEFYLAHKYDPFE